MSLVKGGGSVLAPGFGPPAYVDDWYYPSHAGAMDQGTTGLTTTNTRKYYVPFFVTKSGWFKNACVYNSGVGDSGDDVMLCIYDHDPTVGPNNLMKSWGEVTFTSSAAKAEGTEDEVYLQKGMYWLSVHCNGAADMYALRGKVGTGNVWRGQADLGVPAVDSVTLDCAAIFPYVDETYTTTPADPATAPTSSTTIAPKVWVKAGRE